MWLTSKINAVTLAYVSHSLLTQSMKTAQDAVFVKEHAPRTLLPEKRKNTISLIPVIAVGVALV